MTYVMKTRFDGWVAGNGCAKKLPNSDRLNGVPATDEVNRNVLCGGTIAGGEPPGKVCLEFLGGPCSLGF